MGRKAAAKTNDSGKPGEREAGPNQTGMFIKRKDMRKCDRPIKDLGEGGKRFRAGGHREANPRGLTLAVTIRYKDYGSSEPTAVISRGIYRLQRKSARF